MSDWPRSMEIRPLVGWPGEFTRRRPLSPFRAGLTSTLELLDGELRALGARSAPVLEVAITADQFRLDGRPRAQAKAEHPGVILTIATKMGSLRYPCDRFTTWQDNLRAIALSLEALRKVDRYGVTKTGEQYAGFLALEAGNGSSLEAAIATLRGVLPTDWASPITTDPASLRYLISQAKRAAHPDLGGSTDAFQRVLDAERQIRAATGEPPANG